MKIVPARHPERKPAEKKGWKEISTISGLCNAIALRKEALKNYQNNSADYGVGAPNRALYWKGNISQNLCKKSVLWKAIVLRKEA